MSDFLMGVASFLLVLIPLVIIHEFGHFIAAKLSGITVLEFGIGFPPRALILFEKGDTIYTLNWLPIGGFVRPYGEDMVRQKTPEELAADRSEIEERGIKNAKSVFEAGPWQRMFFMAAGPGINFVAALVLFIVVALVGQPFQRADVAVYDIQSGSAAEEAGLQQGDIIVSVNGDKMDEADEFNEKLSDLEGQAVTLVVKRGDEQFETSFVAQQAADTDIERVYVSGVEDDMPAADAGFMEEDLIVAVDGISVTSLKQLQDYTKSHDGKEMVVTVLRGTERLDLKVTPKKDSGGTPRIGIGISGVEPAIIGLTAINENTDIYTEAQPVGKAIETGWNQFTRALRLLGEFVQGLFNGDVSVSEARPVSPVGIGQIGGPVLEQSLDDKVGYPIINFAAMISIALAITNLLPIPGLDGGRILFVVIELVRGKPMEPEREGMIHFIGLLFLLGLVAITLFNDIFNPINIQ